MSFELLWSCGSIETIRKSQVQVIWSDKPFSKWPYYHILCYFSSYTHLDFILPKLSKILPYLPHLFRNILHSHINSKFISQQTSVKQADFATTAGDMPINSTSERPWGGREIFGWVEGILFLSYKRIIYSDYIPKIHKRSKKVKWHWLRSSFGSPNLVMSGNATGMGLLSHAFLAHVGRSLLSELVGDNKSHDSLSLKSSQVQVQRMYIEIE